MFKIKIIALILIIFICVIILFSGCTERFPDENITITYTVNKENTKIPFLNTNAPDSYDYNLSVNIINSGQIPANNVILNITMLKSSEWFGESIYHEEYVGTLLPNEKRIFYAEFNNINDKKPTFITFATSEVQL